MKLIERLRAPTPKFFRVLRNIGLVLAAAGGSLLAAPIALPAAVITIAGYITVAGGVMTADLDPIEPERPVPSTLDWRKMTCSRACNTSGL